jgi:hypothetical protein
MQKTQKPSTLQKGAILQHKSRKYAKERNKVIYTRKNMQESAIKQN